MAEVLDFIAKARDEASDTLNKIRQNVVALNKAAQEGGLGAHAKQIQAMSKELQGLSNVARGLPQQQKFIADYSRTWKTMRGELGDVTNVLTRELIPGLAGVNIATLGAGAALGLLISKLKETADRGRTALNFSRQTGFTREFIDSQTRLGAALGSNEDAARSFFDTFSEGLQRAQRAIGGGPMIKQMLVSRTGRDLAKEIMGIMHGIGTEAEREERAYAAVQKRFREIYETAERKVPGSGEQAERAAARDMGLDPEFITVFVRKSESELQKLKKTLDDLAGAEMSTKKLDAYAEAIARNKAAAEGFSRSITELLLPALIRLNMVLPEAREAQQRVNKAQEEYVKEHGRPSMLEQLNPFSAYNIAGEKGRIGAAVSPLPLIPPPVGLKPQERSFDLFQYQGGALDTPAGPAMLHPHEMVLPKEVADTVRNAVGGGLGDLGKRYEAEEGKRKLEENTRELHELNTKIQRMIDGKMDTLATGGAGGAGGLGGRGGTGLAGTPSGEAGRGPGGRPGGTSPADTGLGPTSPADTGLKSPTSPGEGPESIDAAVQGGFMRPGGGGDYGNIADAIQKQEGWRKGTVAFDQNNPGNLKWGPFAKAHGATGPGRGGHAIFPDYQTGRNALTSLLGSKGKGQSISQIGKWWAEDPNWAAAVAKNAGVSPSYVPGSAPGSPGHPASFTTADIQALRGAGAGVNVAGAPQMAGDIMGDPRRTGGAFNAPKGAPMSGEHRTVTLSNGQRVTVNARGAEQFKGFFNDLIAAGAPVHSLGGYGLRRGNPSQHPPGLAVDWAQSGRNIVTRDVQKWVSENPKVLNALEQKWGMSGGEHWRNPDTGHFSIQNIWGAKHLEALAKGNAPPTAANQERQEIAPERSMRPPEGYNLSQIHGGPPLSQLGRQSAGYAFPGSGPNVGPQDLEGSNAVTGWAGGKPSIGYNPEYRRPGTAAFRQTMMHETGHAGVKALIDDDEYWNLKKEFPETKYKNFEELRQREADIALMQSSAHPKFDVGGARRLRSAQRFSADISEDIKKQGYQGDAQARAREYNSRLNDLAAKKLGAPSHASGAWNVLGGLANLHKGEMVLPRGIADIMRKGMQGGIGGLLSHIPQLGQLGAMAEKTMHEITGSADLNIDVRAPHGTNVRASAEGLFKQVMLNRRLTMPYADEHGAHEQLGR